MIQRLYSIRDLRSEFWSPRVSYNDESLRRDLAMVVHESGSAMSFAPQDFEVYFIGSFDSKTADLIPCTPIQFLFRLDDLV